jgi:hypothetical protein
MLRRETQCERDSSGTTVATEGYAHLWCAPEGAKVMERIARRKRAVGARSGSPKKSFIWFIFVSASSIIALFRDRKSRPRTHQKIKHLLPD